jgi:hypothetical protein
MIKTLVVLLGALSSTASLSPSSSSSSSSCRMHADCPLYEDRCFFASGDRNEGICFNQKQQMMMGLHDELHNSEVQRVDLIQGVEFLEVDEKTTGKKRSGGKFTLQAPAGNSATLALGEKSYTIGVSKDGSFDVQRDGAPEPYLSFEASGGIKSNLLKMSANNVDAASGFAAIDASGSTLRQWSTIASDTFNDLKEETNKYKGWEITDEAANGGMGLRVQKCGGVTMLGGPADGDGSGGFHRGEISKTFTNLRNHSSVRISASFHFIDLWLGEFAYMKVTSGSKSLLSSSPGSATATVDEYVWTKSYHSASGMGTANHKHPPSGLNICGDTDVVENEFISNIDVSVPHNMDRITVTFGTKLPPNAGAAVGGASWGLSRVDVMIKNVDESQL